MTLSFELTAGLLRRVVTLGVMAVLLALVPAATARAEGFEANCVGDFSTSTYDPWASEYGSEGDNIVILGFSGGWFPGQGATDGTIDITCSTHGQETPSVVHLTLGTYGEFGLRECATNGWIHGWAQIAEMSGAMTEEERAGYERAFTGPHGTGMEYHVDVGTVIDPHTLSPSRPNGAPTWFIKRPATVTMPGSGNPVVYPMNDQGRYYFHDEHFPADNWADGSSTDNGWSGRYRFDLAGTFELEAEPLAMRGDTCRKGLEGKVAFTLRA